MIQRRNLHQAVFSEPLRLTTVVARILSRSVAKPKLALGYCTHVRQESVGVFASTRYAYDVRHVVDGYEAFLLALLTGAAHHGVSYFDYRHALGVGAQVAVANVRRSQGGGCYFEGEGVGVHQRVTDMKDKG